MDMFFEVHDRTTNELLNLNVTDVRTYSEQDFINRDGSVNYLIVYALKENRYIEEEFETKEDRATKLDKLAQFSI